MNTVRMRSTLNALGKGRQGTSRQNARRALLTVRRFTTFTLLCCVPATITASVSLGRTAVQKTETHTVERVVHLNPRGPDESRYVYVPFEVPGHAVQINISYQYDRANGTNAIDIGLFDSRSTGVDTDPKGFRGWSGGRRSQFSVSRNEATPGYMPGNIPAGTWRIILGLYRVAPAGVDVSFKIAVETDQNITGPASKSAEVAKRRTNSSSSPQTVKGPRRWFSGDLHLHTVHSDGDWTIAELFSSARTNGLDFIFITDHNTASHHTEIDRLNASPQTPLVLRGEEITTYGGHTNAWGLPSGS